MDTYRHGSNAKVGAVHAFNFSGRAAGGRSSSVPFDHLGEISRAGVGHGVVAPLVLVDVVEKVGTPDLSNQDLCVSILNSFGMETTTFGDPRFCKGPLPLIKA